MSSFSKWKNRDWPAAVTGSRVHEYVHCAAYSAGEASLPVSWGALVASDAGRFRNKWEALTVIPSSDSALALTNTCTVGQIRAGQSERGRKNLGNRDINTQNRGNAT